MIINEWRHSTGNNRPVAINQKYLITLFSRNVDYPINLLHFHFHFTFLASLLAMRAAYARRLWRLHSH